MCHHAFCSVNDAVGITVSIDDAIPSTTVVDHEAASTDRRRRTAQRRAVAAGMP